MSTERPAGFFAPPAWLLPTEEEAAAYWEAEHALNQALLGAWRAEGERLRAHLAAERERE